MAISYLKLLAVCCCMYRRYKELAILVHPDKSKSAGIGVRSILTSGVS